MHLFGACLVFCKPLQIDLRDPAPCSYCSEDICTWRPLRKPVESEGWLSEWERQAIPPQVAWAVPSPTSLQAPVAVSFVEGNKWKWFELRGDCVQFLLCRYYLTSTPRTQVLVLILRYKLGHLVINWRDFDHRISWACLIFRFWDLLPSSNIKDIIKIIFSCDYMRKMDIRIYNQ